MAAHNREPAWSPDRIKIAYRQSPLVDTDDICIMDAEGTGTVNLANTPGPTNSMRPGHRTGSCLDEDHGPSRLRRRVVVDR